jgi:hypothetical protein
VILPRETQAEELSVITSDEKDASGIKGSSDISAPPLKTIPA